MTRLEKEIQSALGCGLIDSGVQVFLHERGTSNVDKYAVFGVTSEGDVIYANNIPIIQNVTADVNYYAKKDSYDESDIVVAVAAMKSIGYTMSSDITPILNEDTERIGAAMEFSRECVV